MDKTYERGSKQNFRTLRDRPLYRHHVRLNDIAEDTLRFAKANIERNIGKQPSATLVIRRALEVYSRHLAALRSSRDWEHEAARIKALR